MANFFKKIFTGGDSFLGVDIGASSIKIVQLKKSKGVVVLETYGELALGPYADLEIGRATNLSSGSITDALKNLLKEANTSATDCGVSIPLRSSLVFTISMPKLDMKQLEKMIPIEARKYIPVPISEVNLDWNIIPKGDDMGTNPQGEEIKKEEETVDVLIAAIHKDTITKQEEIVKNAKLDLKFIEIEIFSTLRAITSQNMFNFVVLDMGSGSTKLYVIDKGIVRDSHVIGQGSQDITLNISRTLGMAIADAEKEKRRIGMEGETQEEEKISNIIATNLEYIFSETNKAVLQYQKKYNKNIDKIIITGGGAVVKGMSRLASLKLETEVEIADPFSKVESPAFLDDLLKQVGPEFTVALGLALRGLKEAE